MTKRSKPPIVTDESWIEEHLAALRGQIDQFGYTMVPVLHDPETGMPEYIYTVGLQETMGKPDLIMFGVPIATAFELLKIIVQSMRDGMELSEGARLEEVGNLPLAVRTTDERCEAFVSQRLNDDAPAYWQIVWPDQAGVFPWEPGFDERFRSAQPLLFGDQASADSEHEAPRSPPLH